MITSEEMCKRFHMATKKHGNTFPVSVIDIAREMGVSVKLSNDLPDKLSGLIGKLDENFVILVNARHSAGRMSFTIAHEIGHLIEHFDFLNNGKEIISGIKSCLPRCDRIDNNEYNKMEKQANKFAADLLMPQAEFLKKCEEFDSIEEIAQYFGVSVPAASVRANNLGGWFFI